jgi:hypothetical protein
MFKRNVLFGLLLAAGSLVSVGAQAQEAMMDKSFMEMRSVKMMDKNKDSMVSKAEFIEMAGKMFDMRAKAMGIKNGKMSEAQLKEFYKDLYAGGN